jgi:hypothetical protein
MFQMDGNPIFRSVFTVMNEYGEIRVNSFTNGTTNEETSWSLNQMKNTLLSNHNPLPKHFYTDICCSDRSLLESTFPSLTSSLKSNKPLAIPEYRYMLC